MDQKLRTNRDSKGTFKNIFLSFISNKIFNGGHIMIKMFVPVILLLALAACSILTLQPANFAWPIESVLPVNDEGMVMEERYSIEFNTVSLFYEEFMDSSAYNGNNIRMIRDNGGYYYITASKFKNVYVFRDEEGALVLHNKIFISEPGIEDPAFNQRAPYIELIDNGKKINLTNVGVEGGNK